MPLIPVDTLTDPRLAPYANMRDAELMHRTDPALPPLGAEGLFMAEGELVVRRLIASRYPVDSVLTTRTRLESLGDALDGLAEEVPVYIAEPRVLNEIVGFNMHRGLLAVGRRVPAPALGELLAGVRAVVVLEDLTNHDNLGGIFRSAAALAGGDGLPGRSEVAVLLSPRCADPLYRKALRVSMGHVLAVPYARVEPWPEGLAAVRAAGFEVIAMANRPDAVDLSDMGYVGGHSPAGQRPAVLLGSEGPGLTPGALAAADRAVRIPISGGVDSLNVGVAGAIALYALCGR